MPESACITRVDADSHELVGPLAAGRGEVVALALWLLAERAKGEASRYRGLLSALPQETLSPILWDDAQRQELLRGSPALPEAQQRAQAIQQEWQALQDTGLDPAVFPPDVFNERAFAAATCVVLAAAVYLPSAECLALIPGVSALRRTGRSGGAAVDYDAARGCVVLTAQEFISEGDEVCLFDGRPNSELVLAAGYVEANSPSDFLVLQTGLLQADRMYSMKKQILEELGFGLTQEFPIYADRMPTQLLSYLRLARISDTAQLARVTFERDVMINDLNEYEVLQLLMGDCRERLSEYETAGNTDDEIKSLQDRSLPPRQRLAAQLRLEEKRILRGTMDAVRRRLAPIRGIPTKGGQMQDPNADFVEIFETLESIPKAPKKLLDGFLSWARGDNDPDWR